VSGLYIYTGLHVQRNCLRISTCWLYAMPTDKWSTQLKREQRYNARTYHGLNARALHIIMPYVWGSHLLFLPVSYMDCIRWAISDTEILVITTRSGKMTSPFRVLVTDASSAATLVEQSIISWKRCILRYQLWVVKMGIGSDWLRIVSSSGFCR